MDHKAMGHEAMGHEAMDHETMGHEAMKQKNHYRSLLLMTAVSFVAMYILMYAMVASPGHVYNHLNQVYMAGLMAAAMVMIELAVMGAMYPNRTRNLVLFAVSIGAGLLFFLLIQRQIGIGDTQFLRSMIPHHSGAILMCEQASIADPEIQSLCESITSSQQSEINQMEAILARLQ